MLLLCSSLKAIKCPQMGFFVHAKHKSSERVNGVEWILLQLNGASFNGNFIWNATACDHGEVSTWMGLNPQLDASCFDVTEQSNFLHLKLITRFILPLDVFVIACPVCLVFVWAVCPAALLTPGCASSAAGPPPVRAPSWTHSADCLVRCGS